MFMRGLFSFCPSCYQQMQQAKIPSTQLAYTKDRHTHGPHTISDHHCSESQTVLHLEKCDYTTLTAYALG